MHKIKSHEVTGKVVCPKCNMFLGLLTSDGKKPYMWGGVDVCEDGNCPMYSSPLLAPSPPERPTHVGNSVQMHDDDAFAKSNDQ